MVATGGATNGVLFRDAAAIESLRRSDTLIVDKTGTPDRGARLSMAWWKMRGLDGWTCCGIAASLPIRAASIRMRARSSPRPRARSHPHRRRRISSAVGVRDRRRSSRLILGNTALMDDEGRLTVLLPSAPRPLRAPAARA